MKVENYISLYGKLNFFKVYWRNNEDISVFDFLENNPDYELNDNEIDRIYLNETGSLYKYLEGFKDGKELISILRQMFDDYRTEGGEPLFWLHFTYENISLNPQNYPTEFVGLIESNLLLWIENFTKTPIDYLYLNTNPDSFPIQQIETKTDKLNADLSKYGFFELPKVKALSEVNKQNLIEMIINNDLPYNIAMFAFLGFIEYLEKEHFKTKNKLNREVAKWFNSDKDGRRVKGNISTLSEYSNEDKEKYTAHKHKENVKKDYQKLK